MSIEEHIRAYRKYLGYTQEEIANKAGINEKYYGRIERGESKPTFEYVVKICKAMDIEPVELLLLSWDTNTQKELGTSFKMLSTIMKGLKKDVDIHFNRDVMFDGCESSIWYNGYVGSLCFDEFEMKIFAEGNIKGVLYIDYNEVLILNSKDVSNELHKYIKNDQDMVAIMEYMSFDEKVLKKRLGTAFFLSETNWFIAELINNHTGEKIYDDIVLEFDNVIDIFKSMDFIFDYIFE